jgi:succinate dehydrogenase/fumarate reductase flavoprotein subunit
MSDSSENDTGGFSRRDFMKVAGGVGALAMFGPGMSFAANSGVKSMANVKRIELETDVLVVGGGQAGSFAAVKARQQGAAVVMAVKGAVGRSGLTPGANTFFIYDKSAGDNYANYIKQFRSSGEYLNNMDFTEMIIRDSLKTYEEFATWGVITGSKAAFMPGTVTRSYEVVATGDPMRNKVKEMDVNLLERTMITDLLMDNGRVAGAVGFSQDDETIYVIRAKAVCLCAGAGALKNMGQFPSNSITHDGDCMAYRVGAEISGKEFNDPHPLMALGTPVPEQIHQGKDKVGNSGPTGSTAPANLNFDKDAIGFGLEMVFQANQGSIPAVRAEMGGPRPPRPSGPPGGGHGGRPELKPSPYFPNSRDQQIMGTNTGMSNHKGEGLWPKDTSCASNIPGLFAAGDNLCSMQNGANYAGFGTSFGGSAVQGAAAGTSAAKYAKSAGKPKVSSAEISKALSTLVAPREREKGFSPAWVTRALQSATLPYYVLWSKEEKRLQAALYNVQHLRHQIAPLMIARDPHELRLAHETQNMLLNAEMKLQASLLRKESRGTHYREDYPFRDDKNWLSWIILKQRDGEMVLEKRDVPKAWHPDSSKTYEQKYPKRFPGELEALKKNT